MPIALFSIPVLMYGVDIIVNGLTKEPLLAGAMYLLLGIAMPISPGAMLPRGNVGRYVGALVMVLLVLSGVLAFYIGVSATFTHTVAWPSGRLGTVCPANAFIILPRTIKIKN